MREKRCRLARADKCFGGGGSNSSPPSDTPPGGGTFPTDLFGNAYNPDWGGGMGSLGAGVSKGFQNFGSSIAHSAPSVSPFNPNAGAQITPPPGPSATESPQLPSAKDEVLQEGRFQTLMDELFQRMKARAEVSDVGIGHKPSKPDLFTF